MKVSAIVLIYKGEKTLDKCLYSLENQTISKNLYEILTIVDNGGYNETISKILGSHETKTILSSKRAYYGGVRNLGIQNAKGEVVSFIDQDCYASKNWIETIINNFENCDIEMVYGKRRSLFENTRFKRFKELEYIVRAGKFQENERRIFNKKNWKDAYIASGQNMAFKKDVFDKYGFFDECYGPFGSEDIVFQFNLLSNDVKTLFDPKMLVTHDHSLNFLEWLRKSYYYGVGNKLVCNRNEMLLKNKWIKNYFPGIFPNFTSLKNISSKMQIKSFADIFEVYLMESTDYLCKMAARLRRLK